MKVRNGFVSNSSSTSFVVLIPSDFDIDKVDFTSLEDYDEDDCTEEDIKTAFAELIQDGWIWDGSMWDDQLSSTFYPLVEILEDFVILKIDGPSGYGRIILLKSEEISKIKQILDEN